MHIISPIYFFADGWFLSDSEDTEERYGVVKCRGKDSRIHVPHCFIYFFGAKPFPNQERKKKKKAWKQWVTKESQRKVSLGALVGLGLFF